MQRRRTQVSNSQRRLRNEGREPLDDGATGLAALDDRPCKEWEDQWLPALVVLCRGALVTKVDGVVTGRGRARAG